MPAPVSQPNDPALLKVDGPIATITLNRPAAFNSINLAIAQKLEQLAAAIEGDDNIKVLVIEGEGRAFSAGGDLQTIGAAAEANTVTPVVGEALEALSCLHRDHQTHAEDFTIERARLGGGRRHGPRVRHRSLHRR